MNGFVFIMLLFLVMPRVQHEKQPVVKDSIPVDSTTVSDTLKPAVKIILRGHRQKMQMIQQIMQVLEKRNGKRHNRPDLPRIPDI